MADVPGLEESKRTSRSVGFYRDLDNLTTTVADKTKKRPRDCLKGVYTVKDLIGSRYNKRLQQIEYLVKWDNYGSEFNSWEPEEHILDKKQIRNFEKPKIDKHVLESHVEKIRNVVEAGLPNSLQSDTTIYFEHSVFRHLFPGKEKHVGRGSISLEANDFPEKYFHKNWDSAFCSKRHVLRKVRYPIIMRPFLARSRQLFYENGVKRPRRWMQKLTVSFRKKTL